MKTYRKIAEEVRRKHGVVVKTCWIAHMKEVLGLPVRRAPNRAGTIRRVPCPERYRGIIADALRSA